MSTFAATSSRLLSSAGAGLFGLDNSKFLSGSPRLARDSFSSSFGAFIRDSRSGFQVWKQSARIGRLGFGGQTLR